MVSLKSVPFGTAYAIGRHWSGRTVSIGMLLFGESPDLLRVACLLLTVIGAIGLKLVTPQ